MRNERIEESQFDMLMLDRRSKVITRKVSADLSVVRACGLEGKMITFSGWSVPAFGPLLSKVSFCLCIEIFQDQTIGKEVESMPFLD